MAYPLGVDRVQDNNGAYRIKADYINRLQDATVGPALNVKASPYFAVGDGVADDTTALQTAINDLAASTTVSELYFPTGVYRISSTLMLPVMYHKRIRGAYWGDYQTGPVMNGPVILQVTNNIPILKTAGENFNSFGIEQIGLRFLNQQGAANTNAYGLMFSTPVAGISYGWYRWVLDHVKFVNCNVGMGFDPAGTGQYAFWGNRCRDLYFQTTQQSAILFVSPVAAGAEGSIYDGLTILNSGAGITSPGTAFKVSGTEATINNMVIEDWNGTLIDSAGGSPISVQGLHVERCNLTTNNSFLFQNSGGPMTIQDARLINTMNPGGGNVCFFFKLLPNGTLHVQSFIHTTTVTAGSVVFMTSTDITSRTSILDYKDVSGTINGPGTAGWDAVSPTQVVQYDRTFYQGVVLGAGTATQAPLNMTAGTSLTTPAAGTGEYDGKAFYATPNASNRAVNVASHLTTTTADFTGTNVLTAQPVFNTTEDVITLPALTSYLMEGIYHIHTTGTASHTFGILFAGTATLTSIDYAASATNAATEVLGAEQTLWCTAATIQILTAATATATHHTVRIRGIVRVNGAGTFIPQYQWGTTAPGVAGVTLRNSYLTLTPIGSNTVAAIGNWS